MGGSLKGRWLRPSTGAISARMTLGAGLIFLGVLHVPPAWSSPGWFESGSDSSYPTEFYLVGTGSGGSSAAAVEAAQAQILAQLEVKIEADFQSSVRAYGSGEDEALYQKLSSHSRSVTQGTLRGAEVAMEAHEGGTHYAFVALDRSHYEASLRVQMDADREALVSIRGDAERALRGGSPFLAVEMLMKGVEIAQGLHTQTILYSATTGQTYPVDASLSGAALTGEARLLMDRLALDRVGGNDQSASPGRLLPEPLVVRVVYEPESGDPIPASDVRLEATGADGEQLGRSVTNGDGEAEFWVRASDDESVEIGLDPLRVPAGLGRAVREVSTRFRYSTAGGAMAFSVVVRDTDGDREKSVEKTVSKSVEKAGHTVQDGAPFRLEGTVEIMDQNTVDGLEGSLYQVTTELTLFMVYTGNGTKVGSMTVKGKGLDKRSASSAAKKSYKKLKIKKRDMAEMLSEAEGELEAILVKLSKEALQRGKAAHAAGRNREALRELAKVIRGNAALSEAEQLIAKIRRAWAAAAEAERQKEIAVADARARQAEADAEKEIAVADARARQTEADARSAEARAIEADAQARVAEAEAAIATADAQAERDRVEEACWACNASIADLTATYGTTDGEIPERFRWAQRFMENEGTVAYTACQEDYGGFLVVFQDPVKAEECDRKALEACVEAASRL